jgi:hypothetical protein
MIGFVDKAPDVEPHHALFLLTFDSGGEKVQLLLTQSALTLMLGRGARALEDECMRREKAVVLPLRRKGGK